MMWRMVKAVLILPCTAVVLVPGGIYWATAGLTYAGRLSSSGQIQFWVGLAAMGVGLALGFWTASLFVRVGQGTPAPWDPPKNLVVRGPYRHVRNPMISSVLFMLLGEALIFQSWPIGGWGLFFFAVNFVYFLLSEEKALERRFGDEYVAYKANVPRWLPRLNPWPRSEQGDRSDG